MGRKKKVTPDYRKKRKMVGAPFDGSNAQDRVVIDYANEVKEGAKEWKSTLADALLLQQSLEDEDSALLQKQYPEIWKWMLAEARRQAHEEAQDMLRAIPVQHTTKGKPRFGNVSPSEHEDNKAWMNSLLKLSND